jgi:hypothetical protein
MSNGFLDVLGLVQMFVAFSEHLAEAGFNPKEPIGIELRGKSGLGN